ncbi:MAG: hypothetical protein ACRDJE_21130 [Dehalococcoidia bacterium]
MREAGFRGAARVYYDLMSPAERAAIDRIIVRLEHDHTADGMSTFDVPDVPGLLLYDDRTWQVLYSVPDEASLVIQSIAHALDLPP